MYFSERINDLAINLKNKGKKEKTETLKRVFNLLLLSEAPPTWLVFPSACFLNSQAVFLPSLSFPNHEMV